MRNSIVRNEHSNSFMPSGIHTWRRRKDAQVATVACSCSSMGTDAFAPWPNCTMPPHGCGALLAGFSSSEGPGASRGAQWHGYGHDGRR